MVIDRREFVIGSGAMAVAAALPVSAWVNPIQVKEGLPIGQVCYDTYERAGGGRVTYAMVINGRSLLKDGWHYDLHSIREEAPAFPAQPLGPSCRIGEMVEL
jgi:hypothetical protein